ncbi:DUF6503 family protein [Zunongwangia sp. F363]|uniref:DUF6503 family protein n=1 Tax=Autumnicola tepida TaxID=3075595 RepID=A0ABU3CCE5_9FLAO|nr:DUF6503 family protein [Zunongwangia sp. F363]MDT0643887.1 DUF6503 family protein [Zunongwangia sp. F363]
MKNFIFLISILAILCSCNNTSEDPEAQKIVDKAIEIAGGENYERARIDFTFRNKTYRSTRNHGGEFSLERTVVDSMGTETRDVLSNTGLKRFRNDTAVKVADSLINAVSNSVNSVHYFLQLPFGLNAPAANKKLVGRDTIDNEGYYEIKVTFDNAGGGTDHEDEYLYWINDDTYTVDYLAYNYKVNGGGVRFRKAVNPRVINGIRFVDYENFKYKDPGVKLQKLDSLFTAGELTLVSHIRTEDIEVELTE